MKKFTKSLLAIIALCSISMQSNSMKNQTIEKTNTPKFIDEKTDGIVKIWEAKKFSQPPMTTLLATISEYNQQNYEYLYPKGPNPQDKRSLVLPQVSLNTKGWLLKIRANPPFCDVEPLQQRIPVY